MTWITLSCAALLWSFGQADQFQDVTITSDDSKQGNRVTSRDCMMIAWYEINVLYRVFFL
jgi:hypothetical protein